MKHELNFPCNARLRENCYVITRVCVFLLSLVKTKIMAQLQLDSKNSPLRIKTAMAQALWNPIMKADNVNSIKYYFNQQPSNCYQKLKDTSLIQRFEKFV